MRTNLLFLMILGAAAATGQSHNKIKFGDVSEKDFASRIYSIDSSAALIFSSLSSSIYTVEINLPPE